MKGHWFALGEPQDEPVSSELTGKGGPQEAAKGTEASRCQARCRGCRSRTTRVLSYSPGTAAGVGCVLQTGEEPVGRQRRCSQEEKREGCQGGWGGRRAEGDGRADGHAGR